jgi:molybdenum cofactor biosynthesis enzyme MoaA
MKLNSLGLFVGTGQCNARCAHCAGVPIRKFAAKEDGVIDRNLISKTLEYCYDKGARYLSLTSSGEPTLSPLSVTATLEIIQEFKQRGMEFNPVNLYTNGILLGNEEFCNTWLPRWRALGLTTIYITVHNASERHNAVAYGVDSYPSFLMMFSRIHAVDLAIRANIVLCKNTIATCWDLEETINVLKFYGADSVSVWPVRDMQDEIDKELAPPEEEMKKIVKLCKSMNKLDLSFKIRLLYGEDRAVYKTGQKLTLFPDGRLSNSWCN